jgi:hypothetical protein
MRSFFSLILLLIVLVAGAYLGSPWWTVWNLERAAKAGDAHAVAQVVDFPAVRAALSPEITAKLQAALDRDKEKPRGILDKLTMFAAQLFVPKAVDTLVTPEGVTYMVKTAKAPEWSNPFKREKAPPAGQPTFDVWHTGYAGDDLDQFHAVIGNKLLPGRAVKLKLLRRGFMTWKVVALDLVAAPGTDGSYTPAPETANTTGQ